MQRLHLSRVLPHLTQFPARILARARRTPTCWTAVDCSASGLLGVSLAPALHPGGMPQVMKAGVVEASTLSTAGLTQLAAHIAVPSTRWVFVLPRADYRVLVVAEPQVPADEITQSLRWQLAPLLDFPVDEAVLDYITIPTRAWQAEQTQELYAFAAQADTMQEIADLFRTARINLCAIDVAETAQRNLAVLAAQAEEGVGMVVFGEQQVQIIFSWHGELYMDRLIAESLADAAGHPERTAAASARIVLQLQRSLDALRTNFPFVAIDRIVIAGAPATFRAALADTIPLSVETLQLERLFDLSHAPQLADPAVGMRYVTALGAALREMESAP